MRMKRILPLSIEILLLMLAITVPCAPSRNPAPDDTATQQKRVPPSVILISVDTLRADHLSCYGYRRMATPHIDALAQGGTIFTQADSQVPLTLPSHVTLLTSTYPFASGVEDNAAELGPQAVTLAGVLKAHGYRTGAFVGGFVLDARFGLNRGFDEYDSPFDLHRQSGKDPSDIKRAGADVVASAEKWLAEEQGGPFFAFVHLYDLHTPYEIPPQRTHAPGLSGYDQALSYVDSVLGGFLTFLQERALLTHTLVIFVSDHGESLGEHGETTHGYFIYQSTLHVPLIFHWPSQSPKFQSRIEQPVSLLDVSPTILQFLGIPAPAEFQGHSLLEILRGHQQPPEEVYSESIYAQVHLGTAPLRSLRVGEYQYIEAPKAELYDLAQDPGENRNLFGSKPVLALTMRSRLTELRSHYASKSAAATSSLSPEAIERLRALGYLATSKAAAPSGESAADPKDRIRQYEEYGRALIQESEGHLAEADTSMERLLEADPDLIDVRLSLGLDEQKLGRHQQAIAAFQEVLKDAPTNSLAHFNIAVSEFALGQTDEAVKELQAVLALAPYYTRAEELLGTIWLQKQDYEQARSQFNHVLTVDPSDYAAHYNLGVLAVIEKNPAEAERQLQAAIKTDPSAAEAHNTLGSLYLELGMLDPARQEFETAVRLQPKFAWAHYNLGIVLHQENEDAQALREFEMAQEADPKFTRAADAIRQIQQPR